MTCRQCYSHFAKLMSSTCIWSKLLEYWAVFWWNPSIPREVKLDMCIMYMLTVNVVSGKPGVTFKLNKAQLPAVVKLQASIKVPRRLRICGHGCKWTQPDVPRD